MSSRLIRILGADGIAVADGAMGTQLYARGVFINRSFDELNLNNPELVTSVHRDYLDAGADLIETNTFGANRLKLSPHGSEDLVRQINLQGAQLARAAIRDAGANARVVGSVGPLGVRIEPWGALSKGEAREAFREQIQALIDGGVDLLIFETFFHLPELHEAVAAAREVSDEIPVIAQVTVTDEGATPEGITPTAFARHAQDWDVDGLGINCGVGPIAALEAIEELRSATDLPLSAMPNAGAPRKVHGRNIYLSSPDYLASYAKRFIKAGVRIVGGCCGTDPEHIRAIKQSVLASRPEKRAPSPSAASREGPSEPAALAEKSSLGAALAEERFVLGVQLRPPRGCDPARTLELAEALREHGADYVLFPESPGSGRMPPMAIAQLCQREAQFEPVVEFACRDRTLLLMMSELLGAQALGLRNLVLVTAAPPRFGDYPDAPTGPEVDSIGLTNMVRRLNQGLDVGGNPIGQPTSFLFGVYLDPYAIDPDHERQRFAWKVDAGAEYAITPPIVDLPRFEAFMETLPQRLPTLASLPYITSYRTLERMNRDLGPQGVPKPLLDRMWNAEKDGRERDVGAEITLEVANHLRPHVAGLQLHLPDDGGKHATQLIASIR